VWSAAGSRLDALPEVNAAAAAKAADLGCGILLSGDGADELLGVPRFATATATATATVARRRGLAAGVRYVGDVAASGPGGAGELAALAAHLPPRTSRARAYWAANWPSLVSPTASAVLAGPFRQAATAWARAWVH